uniref:Reverse transcriptase Ty1/copia-type domain-containing protein n=1 Tax=Fagus sylvatica TaxID=28930 RepID=A0A2N9GEP2_FAGSY
MPSLHPNLDILPSSHLSNHLQIKLTKDNYLSWKTAIIPYINGNKILHYIDGTTAAPPQHIPSPTSSTTLIPNPAFTSWFEIDQLLLSILVSTISESLVPSLVGRSSSHDVWLTLEKMFSSQSRARVMQTRYHLATLKKGNMSIPDYFQKEKSYADLLASIGQPIHDNDLITQILAGLPSDYNDLVTSINTRLEDMPIDELFGHLLTHELRLEQQATVPDLSIPMANLAAKTFNSTPQGHPHQYSSNRGSNGSRGRGRNNYSRSRSNGGSSSSFPNSNNGSRPPCQICFKVGHTASACWHRFEQQYQAPMASQPASQAFVAATSPSIDQVWYPDTGANNHLTADLSHLNLNAEQYAGHDQDLFSGATLLKGQSKDGLYPLHSLQQIKPRALLGERVSTTQWHARLGHPSLRIVRQSLVQPKPNTNVVGCKWVFRIKRNVAGTIERYKARLVAKGFHQLHGVDYGDTFSPVIKPVTIRTVLSLVVASNWDIRQLDVTNAFLHGVLSEDVYMSQPPGFVHPSYPHHVCHLRKALYGLKQAPRAWYSRLSTRLLDLGFKGCKSDTSLFIHSSGLDLILFLIYGDFALKDLGPLHFFLGVEAHKVDSGMYLSQRRYITNLLRKTNLHEAKPVSSPMASSTILSQYTGSSLSDPSSYRSVVGSLQYLSLTRPDISFAVNKVCQFMANPTEDHWSAVKRILRYLKHTIHHCIFLHRDTNFNIQAFSDADWASCPDDRRSTTGYCLFLGRNLISWTSRKQRTVSRSSTESEYRAVAHASTEIIWLRSLLFELGLVSSTPPLLWCDNIGATYLTANPLFHARTKHIEIDVDFVRDLVASKALSIRFISSKDQLADTFTKPLPTAKFILLRDNLNVRELPLRLRGHIRTALPILVTDTNLQSTDKEELHHQDNNKR